MIYQSSAARASSSRAAGRTAASPSRTTTGIAPGAGQASPAISKSPIGLTPSQMRKAYGMDQILFGNVQGTGAGQTIAIIDAYDSPTAYYDLQQFDRTFGLADPPSFKRVAQD